jgi:hypothetical protein
MLSIIYVDTGMTFELIVRFVKCLFENTADLPRGMFAAANSASPGIPRNGPRRLAHAGTRHKLCRPEVFAETTDLR